jgi:hypothetical protein
MNRRAAIQHVNYLSECVADQWRANGEKYDDQETRAALHALGVTDAEIDEAEQD